MSTQEHKAAAETLLREWYDTTSVGRADVHWSARERLSTMIAAALADAVREARKIAGCVSCEDHAALICNPCAAKGKADAVRVAREEDAKAVCQWCGEGAPAAERRSTTWWHPGSGAVVGGGFRYSQPCGGSPIRDLMPRARAGEGDATAKPVPGGLAHSRQCPSFVGGACLCNLNKSWGEGDATPGPRPDRDFENLKWGKSEHQAFPATPPKKGTGR